MPVHMHKLVDFYLQVVRSKTAKDDVVITEISPEVVKYIGQTEKQCQMWLQMKEKDAKRAKARLELIIQQMKKSSS